jgi:hypothetical protein
MILNSVTRSVSIGRLPPTIFLIYFFFLIVNFLFVVRSAIQLGRKDTGVFLFVPGLF